MPKSKDLKVLVEEIKRTGWSFFVDPLIDSECPFLKRLGEEMKIEEEVNAKELFNFDGEINDSGYEWYMNAAFLAKAGSIVSIFVDADNLKNNPKSPYKEQLKDVPVHLVFSQEVIDRVGFPENEYNSKLNEFYIKYPKEFMKILKLVSVRYERFFGSKININDRKELRRAAYNIVNHQKAFFKDYLKDKALHFSHVPYRPVRFFNYIKTGSMFKSVDEAIKVMTKKENEFYNKSREPLDQDAENKYWLDKGKKIDYDFLKMGKYYWVYKPFGNCDFESKWGKHCGNAGSGEHFISLREPAPPWPSPGVMLKAGQNKITNAAHIMATCDYDYKTGLMEQAHCVVFTPGSKPGDPSNYNGNIKPTRRFFPFYVELLKRPEIRGYNEGERKSYYGAGPTRNFRHYHDLTKEEQKQLMQDILKVFEVTGVDRFKFINLFGVEEAIKQGFVKDDAEAQDVLKKELYNSVRDENGNVKKGRVLPSNEVFFKDVDEKEEKDSKNEALNSLQEIFNA